jgi:hypothetical protein
LVFAAVWAAIMDGSTTKAVVIVPIAIARRVALLN